MIRAALLALLFAAVPAAAEITTFYTPAQASGTLELEGEWAAIQVPAHSDLAGSFSFGALGWTNYTQTQAIGDLPFVNLTSDSPAPFTTVRGTLGPTEGTLSAGEGAGRIVLHAKSIRYVAVGGEQGIFAKPAGYGLANNAQNGPADPFWDHPMPAGTQVVSRGSAITLEASGIDFVGVAGLTFTCPAACPQGGGITRVDEWQVAGYWLAAQRFSYIDSTLTAGELHLEASTALSTAMGQVPAVHVQGSVRLPLSAAAVECIICPANQTLSASGDVWLRDLRFVDEHHLAGDVGGNITAARLDEVAVPVELLTGPVTATATAVIGSTVGALAIRLGWLLVTKGSLGDPLEHPRRKALYGFVVSSPGITFRGLVRASGIAVGTTAHHMAILKRSGLIMEKRHRSTRRFFENHGRFEEDWNWVVALKQPEFQLLYDEVVKQGPAPQRALLDRMSLLGWSRSTTQHRLDRLAEQGVLSIRLQGRYKFYSPRPRPTPRGLVQGLQPAHATAPAPAQAAAP